LLRYRESRLHNQENRRFAAHGFCLTPYEIAIETCQRVFDEFHI
jgi:hypothetical protein